MKNELVTISEGYTFDYLLHGIIAFIFSFFLFGISVYAGVSLIVLGSVLMALKSGIEINVADKKIRTYHSFLFFKRGSWINLDKMNHVKLIYRGGKSEGHSFMGRSVTTAMKIYEMHFVHKESNETIEFHHFSKYYLGRKVLSICVKQLNMSYEDNVEAQRKKTKRR